MGKLWKKDHRFTLESHGNAKNLRGFKNPAVSELTNPHNAKLTIEAKSFEFTCIDPTNGEADWGCIHLWYIPTEIILDSKSLKDYLDSYRMVGTFEEKSIVRIANDLIDLLNPAYLKVRGEFNVRGGIHFWPTVEWSNNENK